MLSASARKLNAKCGCDPDSDRFFFAHFLSVSIWVFLFFFSIEIEYISIFVNVKIFFPFVLGENSWIQQSYCFHSICIHAFQWNFYVRFRFRALTAVSNIYTHESKHFQTFCCRNSFFLPSQFIPTLYSIHSRCFMIFLKAIQVNKNQERM